MGIIRVVVFLERVRVAQSLLPHPRTGQRGRLRTGHARTDDVRGWHDGPEPGVCHTGVGLYMQETLTKLPGSTPDPLVV